MKLSLEGCLNKLTQYLKRREGFAAEWRSNGISGIGLDVLTHIMRENTILVESLEYTRKEQKADLMLKLKEIQFAKL